MKPARQQEFAASKFGELERTGGFHPLRGPLGLPRQ
jgi:hypothetical protein